MHRTGRPGVPPTCQTRSRILERCGTSVESGMVRMAKSKHAAPARTFSKFSSIFNVHKADMSITTIQYTPFSVVLCLTGLHFLNLTVRGRSWQRVFQCILKGALFEVIFRGYHTFAHIDALCIVAG